MEKKEDKMVIAFDKLFFMNDFSASIEQTLQGEFQNGYFTIDKEHLVELNKKNIFLWTTSNKNHESIPIIAKTILRVEFEKYISFILNYDCDYSIKIDSSVDYKVKYYTSQKHNQFQRSVFADSLNIICLQNIVKPAGSMFKLDFLEKKIWNSGITKLIRDDDIPSFNKGPKLKLFYADFQKRNEEVMPLRSGAINYFGAFYSTLISFDRGKYIVLSERRTMPDIRGSAPDGISFTYFLERVD